MDLIELISARGNTSLDSTMELTRSLKHDIDEFEHQVDEINDKIVELGALGAKQGDSAKKAAEKVESYMKDLLFRIEEAIPLISLALTTSGAHLSARLPDSVSPGRLLQAANCLSNADLRFDAGKDRVQVGPVFSLKLYSIFYGAHRVQAITDISWKEEHAKCRVWLERVSHDQVVYSYQLHIEEDLDDGRYHEQSELDAGGRKRTVDVTAVTRLFFSASGRLLEIDGSNTPVLVLKLNSLFQVVPDQQATAEQYGQVEWLAFELYEDGEDEDDEEDEEDEEESDAEDEEYGGKREEGTEQKNDDEKRRHEDDDDLEAELAKKMMNLSLNGPPIDGPSLSLLEYLIRLSALQANDQESMYQIDDERISLYLQDEAAHTRPAGASDDGNPEDLLARHTPRMSSPGRSPRRSPRQTSRMSSPGLSPFNPASRPMTPYTPSRQSGSTSTSDSPEATPWERDRMARNPALRRVMGAYTESPLKSKSRQR
uniref:ARAD1C34694p n=1 Tax=Blastobotrys adeninivorans TaxID=409370 RepID=A0A060T2Q8_BLAAD